MNQEDKQTILSCLDGIECIINQCCNTGWTIQECDERQIQKRIDTIKDIIQPPAERLPACSHSKECAYSCLHIYGVDNSTCQRCTNESDYLHIGAVLYFLRLGFSAPKAVQQALELPDHNTKFDWLGKSLQSIVELQKLKDAQYTEADLEEMWRPV